MTASGLTDAELDELARVFVEAALEQLLAEAAEQSGQEEAA